MTSVGGRRYGIKAQNENIKAKDNMETNNEPKYRTGECEMKSTIKKQNFSNETTIRMFSKIKML
jgi:hypothetical protein